MFTYVSSVTSHIHVFTPWGSRHWAIRTTPAVGDSHQRGELFELAQLWGGVTSIGPPAQSDGKWVSERASQLMQQASLETGSGSSGQQHYYSSYISQSDVLGQKVTVLLCVSMATASITRNHRNLEVYLYIKIHENTKSSKKNNRAKNRMKSVTPSGSRA